MIEEPLWYDVNAYFRQTFGGKVWKILVDTGVPCPHRVAAGGCTFCREETILPGQLSVVPPDLSRQIALGKAALRRKYGKVDRFVVYFQRGSALAAPEPEVRAWLRTALEDPETVAVALSARPGDITDPVQRMLAMAGPERVIFVDIGLQSASDETLRRINRGHTREDFARAVRCLAALPEVRSVAHVIVGLPGEGAAENEATFRFLSGLPLHGVKVHHLQVIRGTPLETEFLDGGFEPLDPETFVRRLADGLECLPPEMVIHRLQGDQPRKWVAAPAWHLRKEEIIVRLEAEFRRRGTRQGSRYQAAGSGL
ncbi:MAG: TIGR01212 family radical SAM protein [Acidobacteria bacterium]|nr:TIGR01212 family radical SAM protein [Acidobacteriota bacterium]